MGRQCGSAASLFSNLYLFLSMNEDEIKAVESAHAEEFKAKRSAGLDRVTAATVILAQVAHDQKNPQGREITLSIKSVIDLANKTFRQALDLYKAAQQRYTQNEESLDESIELPEPELEVFLHQQIKAAMEGRQAAFDSQVKTLSEQCCSLEAENQRLKAAPPSVVKAPEPPEKTASAATEAPAPKGKK